LYERSSLHKTRLDPWEAELEAIVVSSLDGLPFAVQIPSGLAADAKDIGLFKAKVSEIEAVKFFNPIQIDPVISLIFYKARTWTASDVQKAMIKLPDLIDGRQDPSPGMFFVYTSPVYVNFLEHEVRWKMCKDRVQQMRNDGWCMLTWRADFMANGKCSSPRRSIWTYCAHYSISHRACSCEELGRSKFFLSRSAIVVLVSSCLLVKCAESAVLVYRLHLTCWTSDI
jgi:hypothetical protein